MTNERTEEQRLWRLEVNEKSAPAYMLSIESVLPDMEKLYGRTVLGLVTTVAELLSVALNDVIGMKMELVLMQRRVQIAKDVPDYQRLTVEATAEIDKEAASAKREEARAIADAIIVAIDDVPVERGP